MVFFWKKLINKLIFLNREDIDFPCKKYRIELLSSIQIKIYQARNLLVGKHVVRAAFCLIDSRSEL